MNARTNRSLLPAFSLIEIMVTIALLSVIILGLLAMFNQTKRAFTSSMTQSDVMESGRAISEMMARELEQMTPSHAPYLFGNYLSTNFFVERSTKMPAMLQALPGSKTLRTNIIQRFYFLSQVNNEWIGTGYQVLYTDPAGGLGTLYRVSAKTRSRAQVALLSSNFHYAFSPNGRITNLNRIADGVVHLRLRAFATNGMVITPFGFRATPDPTVNFVNVTNVFRYEDVRLPGGYYDYYFVSNAVPAYLELELGILEPRVVERYRAMTGNATAQLEYLSNHVAEVHVFRQSIPIRNVDFHAYQ